MRSTTSVHPTLAASVWPASERTRWLRAILLAVVGTILLTIAAKIKVPFWPVPMTMQTFVVLVLGMAYGWRLGAATLALYLAEGALGLPVFSGTPERGIGVAYILGPTGGYLLGFLLAATAVGWLAEKGWDRSWLSTAGAMLIGNVIIYVPGILWLGALIGMERAIQVGLLPFLLGDGLKLALAVAVLPVAWKMISKKST